MDAPFRVDHGSYETRYGVDLPEATDVSTLAKIIFSHAGVVLACFHFVETRRYVRPPKYVPAIAELDQTERQVRRCRCAGRLGVHPAPASLKAREAAPKQQLRCTLLGAGAGGARRCARHMRPRARAVNAELPGPATPLRACG